MQVSHAVELHVFGKQAGSNRRCCAALEGSPELERHHHLGKRQGDLEAAVAQQPGQKLCCQRAGGGQKYAVDLAKAAQAGCELALLV